MDFRAASVVGILTATLAIPGPVVGAERTRVEAIAVREGTEPAVELTLSQPAEVALGRLANPPRVYVDVKGAVLAPAVARTITGGGAVRKVRIGQFDATTVRVVAEIDRGVRGTLDTSGNVVRIALSTSGEKAAPAPKAAATVPAPKAEPASKPAATPKAQAKGTSEPTAEAKTARAADATPSPEPEARLAVARTEQPLSPPAAARDAARRPLVSPDVTALEERIARRAAAEDWTGVVELYAADTQAVRHQVDSTTRAAVVDALRELGLVYSARKLLGPEGTGEAPSVRIARAELALADGDANAAAVHVAGLEDGAVDPTLMPKLRELRVRLALARGDLDTASQGIGNQAAPVLRAELATSALDAGRSAADRRACGPAVDAYRRALDAEGGRTARAAAAAGLVRAALACDDAAATTDGLGVLAESPHPLLRRAAAVIAATQTDAKRQVTPPRRGE